MKATRNITSDLTYKILKRSQEIYKGMRGITRKQALTTRQVEVLYYICQGHNDKEIAVELNIKEQTVKNHIASIMVKFNVKTRTGIRAKAVNLGLISMREVSTTHKT